MREKALYIGAANEQAFAFLCGYGFCIDRIGASLFEVGTRLQEVVRLSRFQSGLCARTSEKRDEARGQDACCQNMMNSFQSGFLPDCGAGVLPSISAYRSTWEDLIKLAQTT